MLNRLTPIVKHLIIINVVVFVGLMIAQTNFPEMDGEWFTLHKVNAVGQFVDLEIDGKTVFFPRGGVSLQNGTTLEAEDAKQVVAMGDSPLRTSLRNGLPEKGKFLPVQIVTHFFNHSKSWILHIFFNMFVLAALGPLCEMVLGNKRFLRFYLFCGVVGGLMIAFLDPSPNPVVGASGAISGVLVAFALFFPREKLQILFIPFGFEARYFVTAIGVLSAVMVALQFLGISDGGAISHFGHLAGMLAALLYFYVEKYLPFLRE